MKISFLTTLVAFIVFCTIMMQPTVAEASIDGLTVDTGCTKLPSYTGKINLEKGTYDVYAQLGRRGEKANVTIYTQDENDAYGQCRKLNNINASGVKWRRAGSFTAAEHQTYVFQLASTAMANVPDANRPSIMIVPKAKQPLCVPTDECYINVYGQRAYLRPVGTLLNQNSLHVLVVADPTKDAIKEVRYYVGGHLVYTRDSLEPLDVRYIEYSGQRLERVVVYESGQQAVIETSAPLTHQDSFPNFLFRLSQRYPDTLRVVVLLVVVLIVSFAAFMILRILYSREQERARRGFRRELGPSILERIGYLTQSRKSFQVVQGVVIGAISLASMGLILIFINTYLMQIVTVSGHSMEKTLFTGDRVLLNKLPKTVAGLNNREYVPARGDVVIVRSSFGNTAISSEDDSELTLIKRVIGLPGERVIIKDGVLTVQNSTHPKGFQPDKGSVWEAEMTKDLPTENIDIQLGPSEIFVSGDNRPESIDSRFNGPLATKEIIGVVVAHW